LLKSSVCFISALVIHQLLFPARDACKAKIHNVSSIETRRFSIVVFAFSIGLCSFVSFTQEFDSIHMVVKKVNINLIFSKDYTVDYKQKIHILQIFIILLSCFQSEMIK
jgi:hypothetical protein